MTNAERTRLRVYRDEPADVAEVVAFLSGSGRWVNGQIIRANGVIV